MSKRTDTALKGDGKGSVYGRCDKCCLLCLIFSEMCLEILENFGEFYVDGFVGTLYDHWVCRCLFQLLCL